MRNLRAVVHDVLQRGGNDPANHKYDAAQQYNKNADSNENKNVALLNGVFCKIVCKCGGADKPACSFNGLKNNYLVLTLKSVIKRAVLDFKRLDYKFQLADIAHVSLSLGVGHNATIGINNMHNHGLQLLC